MSDRMSDLTPELLAESRAEPFLDLMADPMPDPRADPRHAPPGRSCPLHYRYRPEGFARAEVAPALRGLDVLYVVGGLYGNELALHQVLRLFERERGRRALVFNGDFHWFDVDSAVFARVQREVLAHAAQRGNVETELAATPPEGGAAGGAADAGCGCAYPAWVGDAVVERSNRILTRLRGAASAQQRAELAALPTWQVASVGPWRIGLVHGDAESLAGWGFAQEHLRKAARRDEASGWFARAGVQAFACSHTCLPVSALPRRLARRQRCVRVVSRAHRQGAGVPGRPGRARHGLIVVIRGR